MDGRKWCPKCEKKQVKWCVRRGFFECANCKLKLTSKQVKALMRYEDGEVVVVVVRE